MNLILVDCTLDIAFLSPTSSPPLFLLVFLQVELAAAGGQEEDATDHQGSYSLPTDLS